jgi:hypothetical protein
MLPGDVGKYLPGILKLAEVLGHGLGDDTPRTEKNSDGSIIDDFLKTLISGRKIFGGSGGKTIKDTSKGGRKPSPTPAYDEEDGGGFDGSASQDYEDLKTQCLSAGVLFEDEEFPAVSSSVFFSSSSWRSIYWKRPHEIDSNLQFFVDGASR